MKTALQKSLAAVAPSISIKTLWKPDEFCGPISQECDGFNPCDDHKWMAWQSEIRATAIQAGEEISGSAYLGGTFELYGDDPAKSNPTISGYEGDMTREALTELRKDVSSAPLIAEIEAALEHLSS